MELAFFYVACGTGPSCCSVWPELASQLWSFLVVVVCLFFVCFVFWFAL